ncbi:hypothetical protein CHUAL_008160 [Chamberlinius hualienensis]
MLFYLIFRPLLTISWIVIGFYLIAHSTASNGIEESTFNETGNEQPYITFTLNDGHSNESMKIPLHFRVVKFVVKVEANPPNPVLQWFKETKQIFNSTKYNIFSEDEKSTLIIMDVVGSDSGFYILEGKTGNISERFNLSLTVTEEPKVQILPSLPTMHKYKNNFLVKCVVQGCPASKISWHWSPCFTPSNCQRNYHQLNSSEENEEVITDQSMGLSENCATLSFLSGVAYSAGYYMCEAENAVGKNSSEIPIFIKEFSFSFGATASKSELVEGNDLELNCQASIFYYSDVEWFWLPPILNNRSENQSIKLTNTSYTKVRHTQTLYTYFTDVHINPVSFENSGQYICRATQREGQTVERPINIKIIKPSSPIISDTNMNDANYTVYKDQYFNFICRADGVPQPEIKWYLNGVLVRPTVYGPFQLYNNGTQLRIVRALEVDSGQYMCTATNNAGSSVSSATLTVIEAASKSSKLSEVNVMLKAIVLVAMVIPKYV